MPKKIRFNSVQKRVFIDVSVAAGQLIFGSTVLPFAIKIPGLDKPPLQVLILGLVLTVILWLIIPYFLAKKLKT